MAKNLGNEEAPSTTKSERKGEVLKTTKELNRGDHDPKSARAAGQSAVKVQIKGESSKFTTTEAREFPRDRC